MWDHVSVLVRWYGSMSGEGRGRDACVRAGAGVRAYAHMHVRPLISSPLSLPVPSLRGKDLL